MRTSQPAKSSVAIMIVQGYELSFKDLMAKNMCSSNLTENLSYKWLSVTRKRPPVLSWVLDLSLDDPVTFAIVTERHLTASVHAR